MNFMYFHDRGRLQFAAFSARFSEHIMSENGSKFEYSLL